MRVLQTAMPVIRVLQANDAAAFRALRMQGLRESPEAFAASYEDEAALPMEEVVRRIGPTEDAWVLGAFATDGSLAGCIGWYRDQGRKMAHKSHVWGMYVAPDYRRQGISRALIDELIARVATNPGIAQIELFVTVENVAATRLYAAAGFEKVAILPRSLYADGRYIDDALLIRRMPAALQVDR